MGEVVPFNRQKMKAKKTYQKKTIMDLEHEKAKLEMERVLAYGPRGENFITSKINEIQIKIDEMRAKERSK